MVPKHEVVACVRCADWVVNQPVQFPVGCALQGRSVEWWDLRNLKAARDFEGRVGSRPQTAAAMRDRFASYERGGTITSVEAYMRRLVAKGLCVEAGVEFAGLPEEAFETQMLYVSVVGAEL